MGQCAGASGAPPAEQCENISAQRNGRAWQEAVFLPAGLDLLWRSDLESGKPRRHFRHGPGFPQTTFFKRRIRRLTQRRRCSRRQDSQDPVRPRGQAGRGAAPTDVRALQLGLHGRAGYRSFIRAGQSWRPRTFRDSREPESGQRAGYGKEKRIKTARSSSRAS